MGYQPPPPAPAPHHLLSQIEAPGVKENIQAGRADHTEPPPDLSSRPLHVLFRRENFRLNLRPERIPIPQMLSLRIIIDNVVLIRRAEILASVQEAHHLRLRQHRGCRQPAGCEAAQVDEFKPSSCTPGGEGSLHSQCRQRGYNRPCMNEERKRGLVACHVLR